MFDLANWEDFRTLLEKHLEKTGQDIYVAKWTVLESEGSEAHHSIAVLTKDVDTILPVVDQVYFVELDGKKTTIVGWTAAMEALSGFVTPWEKAPECYRVRGFPTAEQLAKIAQN